MQARTYDVLDRETLARVGAFLSAHADRASARPVLLEDPEADASIELPPAMLRLLEQTVESMQHGLAVTVAPHQTLLTTQQVAELLNVSRPTVVKLLDRGVLHSTRAGTHRRVLLGDALTYRDAQRAAQYDALDALSAEERDEETVELALAGLRRARKARRRA